ncbi:SIR2 family NAD-dependent protein deacylase [Pseudoxanthomonas wuyuanensis]
MSTSTNDTAKTVASLIADANSIAILTGAGMSAESGIPTFRGQHDSLWSRFDPQQLASADAWRADKALVWGWYRWRMALVRQAQPHAGHVALAGLAIKHGNVSLVTQNVDDLHERAGSQVTAHVHGSLFALRCFDCGQPYRSPLNLADPQTAPLRLAPPRCPQCGGDIRPGVVWFGEALPGEEWSAAEAAAASCDLMLVIGTSGLVYPAAGLPALAQRHGARVVEINPETTALTPQADLHWPAAAAYALPCLLHDIVR